MTVNTFLLLLLVIAAYSNLYIQIKAKQSKTKMPISSKEWNEINLKRVSYRDRDKKFESWQKNKDKLNRK